MGFGIMMCGSVMCDGVTVWWCDVWFVTVWIVLYRMRYSPLILFYFASFATFCWCTGAWTTGKGTTIRCGAWCTTICSRSKWRGGGGFGWGWRRRRWRGRRVGGGGGRRRRTPLVVHMVLPVPMEWRNQTMMKCTELKTMAATTVVLSPMKKT